MHLPVSVALCYLMIDLDNTLKAAPCLKKLRGSNPSKQEVPCQSQIV